MGLKITQKETEFNSYFQEDIDQYYDIANEFLNSKEVNFSELEIRNNE